MKTLKGRFIRTTIWMAVISAIWVVLATLLLFFVFSISQPGGVIALLEELKYLFSGMEGVTGIYLIFWALLICFLMLGTCIALSANLSRAVLEPMKDLRKAAENIAEGNLSFDVMSCQDQELNELCDSFEEIRKRLRVNAQNELRIEEERSMLMANISHDMRTPITTIKGYLEGIRDGVADTPEKLERYLSTIYGKALVLETLVDSMTEYSELELGRMQYVFEFVNLTAYVRDLAEEYQVEVTEKNLTFQAEFPEEILIVAADRNKLKRVLDNLVSNGVKYNKAGGGITLKLQSDGKGALMIVSDTGSGIKNEDVKNIFDGFYRGDAARSNIKGNGLGLSIARRITEDHKGKIWIKSKEGEGTEVFIYLPLRERV